MTMGLSYGKNSNGRWTQLHTMTNGCANAVAYIFTKRYMQEIQKPDQFHPSRLGVEIYRKYTKASSKSSVDTTGSRKGGAVGAEP